MMRCHKAEEWLLRSQDGFLDEKRKSRLEGHVKSCPICAGREKEYRTLMGWLREETNAAEPLPRFWERLQAKLKTERNSGALVLWQRWCLRAIPVFLGLALACGAALVFFGPWTGNPMTQSERLLLKDQNTLADTPSFFEGGKTEDRPIRLIFASAEEIETLGRNKP